jgi:predicted nucleotidyltransferase component of viral defense system
MNRIIFKQKLEVVQLVVLHRLFSTPASKETIFQGGTALRWGYGCRQKSFSTLVDLFNDSF